MCRLLILCVFVIGSYGINFDVENVKKIYGTSNSYFGYSVILQKGRQSAVIVGAPGNNDRFSGGTLHYCTLDGNCSDYVLPESRRGHTNSVVGNLLGSAIDSGDNVGDQLIICAPKVGSAYADYYLQGYCLLKRNSTLDNTPPPVVINPLQKKPTVRSNLYYDYGFAEVGLDAHYLKEENQVLIGAPGVKNWNGIMVVQSLKRLNTFSEIPYRSGAVTNDNFAYLGYKVTSARLESTRRKVWYIAGAPRNKNLLGNVRIYDNTGREFMRIQGFEIGAYFGSSILAVDLNNDRVDDLLIGAPMGKGSSWDEGYVYFYKSYQNKFENPITLIGSKKAGARFGSCMTSLGDVDLDSFNDVAISAPYEDDGVGAVYIYRGSKTGISMEYSQRLSPKKFFPSVATVRGFGQGLSRGVDIDGNGHNDLAVGAYKSDQVFIIKTLSIIDFYLTLESDVSSITDDVINVRYCVYYTQRSKTNNLKSINFKVDLILDYRAEGEKHIAHDLWTIDLAKNDCKLLDIKLKPSPLDTSAFKMVLKSEILQKNLIGKGENKVEKLIPYSHGCGDDNICQTLIFIEALSSLQNIVLGKDKEIVVNVSAYNVGEPGYGCKLYLNFTNVIELRDTKDCLLENSTYICPFGTKLMDRKETQFKFDIKLEDPGILDKITISFELKCLGENSPPGADKNDLSLNVLLENSPRIQGSFIPDDNSYFNDDDIQDVDISHIFTIGNSGPSPVKLDVFLLLPTIKRDETDVISIIEAKGSLNGIQIQCYPTNNSVEAEESYDVQSLLKEPLNKTIVIDCSQRDIQCLELFCNGEYLYKSTKVAEYIVNIRIRTNLLVEAYRDELKNKGILAYISTAYLYNSAKSRIRGHATSQIIFAPSSKPVPLWIYVVASILGIIILGLLIFLLYKCHFFDRNYRDKLKDEKLMGRRMGDGQDGEFSENVLDGDNSEET